MSEFNFSCSFMNTSNNSIRDGTINDKGSSGNISYDLLRVHSGKELCWICILYYLLFIHNDCDNYYYLDESHNIFEDMMSNGHWENYLE